MDRGRRGSGGGRSQPPLQQQPAPQAKGRHIIPNISVGEHHGGSFRVYMQHKNSKLHDQFHQHTAVASSSSGGDSRNASTIFAGKVFTVNGRVDPPLEEIRRLVVDHGGQFDLYHTSRLVSHHYHLRSNHPPLSLRTACCFSILGLMGMYVSSLCLPLSL